LQGTFIGSLFFFALVLRRRVWYTNIHLGAVAQLGERLVRNEEVGGSNPPSSIFSIPIPHSPTDVPFRYKPQTSVILVVLLCCERLHSTMDFRERYRSAVRALIGHYYPSDGVSEKNLSAIETRLQRCIPTALRDYYLITGGLVELNEAYHRLLHPINLRVEHGKLVFMEGNQSAVVWGTDCLPAESDPTVYQAAPAESPFAWSSEEMTCSDFLHVMLYWQSVCGGLEFHGSASLSHDSYQKMKQDWEFVGSIGNLKAFQRFRMALCASPSETSVAILYGASDRSAYDLILHELRNYGSVEA
jgi:hypothetical protein